MPCQLEILFSVAGWKTWAFERMKELYHEKRLLLFLAGSSFTFRVDSKKAPILLLFDYPVALFLNDSMKTKFRGFLKKCYSVTVFGLLHYNATEAFGILFDESSKDRYFRVQNTLLCI